MIDESDDTTSTPAPPRRSPRLAPADNEATASSEASSSTTAQAQSGEY